MKPEKANTIIVSGLRKLAGLQPNEEVRYLSASDIDYQRREAVYVEPNFKEISSDEMTASYLEAGAAWLNATLIRMEDGSALVALESGQNVGSSPEALSINFSAERRVGVLGKWERALA